MLTPAQETSTCPICGSALEETSGGRLGCTVCLLRIGIGAEDDGPQSALGRSTAAGEPRFGVYEIDCRADASLCELGRGATGVTYRATDTKQQRVNDLRPRCAPIPLSKSSARKTTPNLEIFSRFAFH